MAKFPRQPRTKYGAKATTVDGIRFHSQKEARRYGELKLLEKAGEIHQLRLQHRMTLLVYAHDAPPGYPLKKIGEYVADFAYCVCRELPCNQGKPGSGVVEDVKGFKTPLYRWKKKHVMAQYGIEIKEV